MLPLLLISVSLLRELRVIHLEVIMAKIWTTGAFHSFSSLSYLCSMALPVHIKTTHHLKNPYYLAALKSWKLKFSPQSKHIHANPYNNKELTIAT